MQNLAPIILFVYNRPEHTYKTVEALKRNELASDSLLYVFADGPKSNADSETLIKIQQVSEYIHTITGFKEIIITEQVTNKGLDLSVIDGVTQVLNKHGRCITVEDDIVTHPWFLKFINECLDKYEDDKRICMIGGYNVRMKMPWWYCNDVFLAHRCCSWGWGIWKDRWDDIDWNLNGYNEFLKNADLKKKFCRGGDDMLPMLIEQMKHKVPAWDIRWDYTLMKKNGYVLRPVKSLVINCGLDGTGVHCGIADSELVAAELPKQSNYDIVLPSTLKPSRFVQKAFKQFYGENPSCIRKKYVLMRHYFHVFRLSLFDTYRKYFNNEKL